MAGPIRPEVNIERPMTLQRAPETQVMAEYRGLYVQQSLIELMQTVLLEWCSFMVRHSPRPTVPFSPARWCEAHDASAQPNGLFLRFLADYDDLKPRSNAHCRGNSPAGARLGV